MAARKTTCAVVAAISRTAIFRSALPVTSEQIENLLVTGLVALVLARRFWCDCPGAGVPLNCIPKSLIPTGITSFFRQNCGAIFLGAPGSATISDDNCGHMPI